MNRVVTVVAILLLLTPQLSVPVFAAESDASLLRAAERLAAAERLTQAEERSSGRNKALLWTGLALIGGGVALMVASQGSEECTDILHAGQVIGTECVKEDNIGAGVAGLGAAIAGVTFTVIGARQEIQVGPRAVAYRIGF